MMDRLQERILGTMPSLEASTPKKLLTQIRSLLNGALACGELDIPQYVIHRDVNVYEKSDHEFVLIGGKKDFKRSSDSAILIRSDRAWLHFTMTLRYASRAPLEILAYNFELVFPSDHKPSFVRFDFNPPGHDNEMHGLRSHVHPGNADLQLPAPLMAPVEILNLMLYRLRPRDPACPRMQVGDDDIDGTRSRP